MAFINISKYLNYLETMDKASKERIQLRYQKSSLHDLGAVYGVFMNT